MREIEFRGKRKDNGRWVYGYVRKHYLLTYINEHVHKSDFDYYADSEITPGTVGQYTGYKDISGVKIFEGDIVLDNRGCRRVVEYVNGGFHRSDDAYSIGYYEQLLRVIGNIHDNHELLKDDG
jgi:uncharacterized phage protein (TIGR01671 family)